MAQMCRTSKFCLAELVIPYSVRSGKQAQISSAFDWRGMAESVRELLRLSASFRGCLTLTEDLPNE